MVKPHRLDRARQRSHLVAESFDIGERGGLRPRLGSAAPKWVER
jgi:hypothetical protein